jgi:uncharacterized membrane protein YdfJ with MMPL/SSD domain
LLGASLGLLVTHNPFGFTGFLGIVSLGGVVVRNAIILVDYIRERMKEGVAIEEAAVEAGERRLRPIFLTTMAAAVGVTPMILSGSSMWSPLGSAIAFGLVGSMFFTLVVIPVLYVVIHKRGSKPRAGWSGCGSGAGFGCVRRCRARAARTLTLDEAVSLATQHNSAVKIAGVTRSRRWTRAFAKRGRATSRRWRTIQPPCTSASNSTSKSRKARSVRIPQIGPYRVHGVAVAGQRQLS